MLQTFITQSCLKLCSSRQMQGVVGTALNRRHKLRVWCAASASRSSAEAASSVLSTSPESWIARVGRANSSTRQSSIINVLSLVFLCLNFCFLYECEIRADLLAKIKKIEKKTNKIIWRWRHTPYHSWDVCSTDVKIQVMVYSFIYKFHAFMRNNCPSWLYLLVFFYEYREIEPYIVTHQCALNINPESNIWKTICILSFMFVTQYLTPLVFPENGLTECMK